MKKLSLIIMIFGLGLIWGCSSFVQEVEPLIDQVEDDRLSDASQVPFLTAGVYQRMSTTSSRMAMYADALSDALIFDQVIERATFPSFQQIENGAIERDNNSVDGLNTNLNEARFFADNLIERVNGISGLDDETRNDALFAANLVGGLMRQYMATYWALNKDEPGGVIDGSPLIPAAQMYTQAMEKYNVALTHADDFERRAVNTLMARIEFFQGNYGAAATLAANGLAMGDEPFNALHDVTSENAYYFGGGNGRVQFIVDMRFNGYVQADAAEAARIPLNPITGTDMATYYYQDRYPNRETAFPVATWQENHLMLAEADLRNGAATAALAKVNDIRSSYGIADLASIDMDGLMVERDKTLFTLGFRLVDQRRTNSFHISGNPWMWFPITERELNQNKNLTARD